MFLFPHHQQNKNIYIFFNHYYYYLNNLNCYFMLYIYIYIQCQYLSLKGLVDVAYSFNDLDLIKEKKSIIYL